MDDADALIAQASDLVEGLSEGAGTPPPPPPGTDTGAAHNNTVEVGSVPLATLPSSALPSALPTSDAGRTLPPSSAPTITPLPVPVSDVAVVEAAAPAHNPDDSSDDEELKAPDTGLVLVPDNVADKPLDEHPGLVPLVPGMEFFFPPMITCNAKRKLNTVPYSHPFFHFSNPGRVGVEPHFTDRLRCVRFTTTSPFLPLLFSLLYCLRGWGENIKRNSGVRFQFCFFFSGSLH